MDNNNGGTPGADREAYNNYQDFLQRRVDESSYLAEYRAQFQARKDAKRAGEKAIKAEPRTLPQSMSTIPLLDKESSHGSNQDESTDTSTNLLLPTRESLTTSGSIPHDSHTSDANQAVHNGRKRASDAAMNEERRPSTLKHAKRNSIAAPSELPDLSATVRTGTNRQPPQWYKDLPKPDNKRDRRQSTEDTSLARVKDAIKKVKLASGNDRVGLLPKVSDEILDRLHKLVFLPVNDKLLRKTRMLDNSDGLPQLFDESFSGGINWPWYLQADAEELYNKWCTKMFETDLYRGLNRALKVKGKSTSGTYDTLAEDSERFRLVDPKQHGNGLLLNGSWWPTQLAVLRDGGHGSSQGGITSHPRDGAFSVIMAGGLDPNQKPYPNVDNGNEVLYCGTDNLGPENEPSRDTKAMILNYGSKHPVRLFRSSNLSSPYAPEQGFRYDGLYTVAGVEVMDPPEEKRKRHRFRLVRCEGQNPIRSEGPAKRPTKKEIEEYEKDKKNRGR